MGRLIAEFGGKFCEWSTVVDAPVTYLMDYEQFVEYINYEYGQEGIKILPQRMAVVAKQGTSSSNGTTKQELIEFNRAGDNESHLHTEAQIMEKYSIPNAEECRVIQIDDEELESVASGHR